MATRTRNIFGRKWNLSDVVFIVEEEEFHGHYNILASVSDVFSKLMKNYRKEDGTIGTINLPGKEPKSFYMLFTFLYPSAVKPEISQDRKVLHRVLELTKEFNLGSIALQIDVLLSRQIINANETQTIPNIVRDLYIADKHNLKATRIFCVKFLISADGKVDFEQQIYKNLSAETKLEILSERLFKFINTTKTYIPELNRSVVQFSRENTSWEILKTLSSIDYR